MLLYLLLDLLLVYTLCFQLTNINISLINTCIEFLYLPFIFIKLDFLLLDLCIETCDFFSGKFQFRIQICLTLILKCKILIFPLILFGLLSLIFHFFDFFLDLDQLLIKHLLFNFWFFLNWFEHFWIISFNFIYFIWIYHRKTLCFFF